MRILPQFPVLFFVILHENDPLDKYGYYTVLNQLKNGGNIPHIRYL